MKSTARSTVPIIRNSLMKMPMIKQTRQSRNKGKNDLKKNVTNRMTLNFHLLIFGLFSSSIHWSSYSFGSFAKNLIVNGMQIRLVMISATACAIWIPVR